MKQSELLEQLRQIVVDGNKQTALEELERLILVAKVEERGIHCPKCLVTRSDDVLGAPCQSRECNGVIQLQPTYEELYETLDEEFLCPRRSEGGPMSGRGKDHWDKHKSNGDRVCSYCGSLHPDDFMRLVGEAAHAGEELQYRSCVEIEPSTKGYKVYVKQPGVRNADEGGIKFYTMHFIGGATEEQHELYVQAVTRSNARFRTMMNTMRTRG